MVTATIVLFFKILWEIAEFFIQLAVLVAQLIIQFLAEVASCLFQRWKKKLDEKPLESKTKNKSGKYAIVKFTESGKVPIAYYDTYMEAYLELRKKREQDGSINMIIQEIK